MTGGTQFIEFREPLWGVPTSLAFPCSQSFPPLYFIKFLDQTWHQSQNLWQWWWPTGQLWGTDPLGLTHHSCSGSNLIPTPILSRWAKNIQNGFSFGVLGAAGMAGKSKTATTQIKLQAHVPPRGAVSGTMHAVATAMQAMRTAMKAVERIKLAQKQLLLSVCSHQMQSQRRNDIFCLYHFGK